MRKIIIIILISFGSLSWAFCQWSLKELNLAHQYDPNAEVFAETYNMVSEDSISVVINFSIEKEDARLYDYTFDVFLENTVTNKLDQPLLKSTVDSLLIESVNKSHIIQFKAPYNQEKWAIVRVMSNYSNYSLYFECPISQNQPSFLLSKYKQPIYSQYINPGEMEADRDLIAFYYKQEFEPAIAPMVTSRELPAKEMTLDSIFNWQANTSIHFEKHGLYLFQTDTSTAIGRGLRVESKYYPKLASLKQLVEPLIYITTNDEYDNLKGIEEKKDFDKFWLDLSESANRAKKIIREYYNRVEISNRFFTSFKQGWKTDMGMIYIIYGPPDEVIKTSQGENWVYLSNARFPKIEFEFIKANTIFSSSHYVLIRNKDYDNIWFRAVDLWRKGRF